MWSSVECNTSSFWPIRIVDSFEKEPTRIPPGGSKTYQWEHRTTGSIQKTQMIPHINRSLNFPINQGIRVYQRFCPKLSRIQCLFPSHAKLWYRYPKHIPSRLRVRVEVWPFSQADNTIPLTIIIVIVRRSMEGRSVVPDSKVVSVPAKTNLWQDTGYWAPYHHYRKVWPQTWRSWFSEMCRKR